MPVTNTIIVLFCVATAVALLVRHLRIPYTVALVLAGFGLGALRVVDPPQLTKELLFAIFLPGLLFEAAFHLSYADFRRDWVAITALAIPGVVMAVAVTGLLVAAAVGVLDLNPRFTWASGLVFGALIAATDPIAVTALFRQLSAPKRLSVLVEGESLLNDGTGIVVLSLILAYVTGSATSIASLGLKFVAITGGGALVGGAVGLVISQVIRRIDDAMIEIALTTIAAYGSFALGEQFKVSGVIATVIAGMVCGSYAREIGMSKTTRLAVETFWEYVAFALNSVVFLLIGFTVFVRELAGSWREIAIAYVAVLAARVVVVRGVSSVLWPRADRIPRAWRAVLTWGALRGALSMVLALGLPADFPERELLVTMTVGVVLLSLLVQGTTMARLLRGLGLAHERVGPNIADPTEAVEPVVQQGGLPTAADR